MDQDQPGMEPAAAPLTEIERKSVAHVSEEAQDKLVSALRQQCAEVGLRHEALQLGAARSQQELEQQRMGVEEQLRQELGTTVSWAEQELESLLANGERAEQAVSFAKYQAITDVLVSTGVRVRAAREALAALQAGKEVTTRALHSAVEEALNMDADQVHTRAVSMGRRRTASLMGPAVAAEERSIASEMSSLVSSLKEAHDLMVYGGETVPDGTAPKDAAAIRADAPAPPKQQKILRSVTGLFNAVDERKDHSEMLARARELREKYKKQEQETLADFASAAAARQKKYREVRRRSMEQEEEEEVVNQVASMVHADRTRERKDAEDKARKELALLMNMADQIKEDAEKAEAQRFLRNEHRHRERVYNFKAIRLLRQKELQKASSADEKTGKQQRIQRALRLAQSIRASVELKAELEQGQSVEAAQTRFEQKKLEDEERRKVWQDELNEAMRQLELLEEQSESEGSIEIRLGRRMTVEERKEKRAKRTARARARAQARKQVATLQEEMFRRQAERAKEENQQRNVRSEARKTAERIRAKQEEQRRLAEERAARAAKEEQDLQEAVAGVVERIVWELEAPEREERDVQEAVAFLVDVTVEQEEERERQEAAALIQRSFKRTKSMKDARAERKQRIRQEAMRRKQEEDERQYRERMCAAAIEEIVEQLEEVEEEEQREAEEQAREMRAIEHEVSRLLRDMKGEVEQLDMQRKDHEAEERRKDRVISQQVRLVLRDCVTKVHQEVEVEQAVAALVLEVEIEDALDLFMERATLELEEEDQWHKDVDAEVEYLMDDMLDVVDDRVRAQEAHDTLQKVQHRERSVRLVKAWLKQRMPPLLQRARDRIRARQTEEEKKKAEEDAKRHQAAQVMSAIMAKKELEATKEELDRLRSEYKQDREAVIAEAMKRLKVQQEALEKERERARKAEEQAAAEKIQNATYWHLRKKRLKTQLATQRLMEQEEDERRQVSDAMESILLVLEHEEQLALSQQRSDEADARARREARRIEAELRRAEQEKARQEEEARLAEERRVQEEKEARRLARERELEAMTAAEAKAEEELLGSKNAVLKTQCELDEMDRWEVAVKMSKSGAAAINDVFAITNAKYRQGKAGVGMDDDDDYNPYVHTLGESVQRAPKIFTRQFSAFALTAGGLSGGNQPEQERDDQWDRWNDVESSQESPVDAGEQLSDTSGEEDGCLIM